LPIRQITICLSIFLVIILTGLLMSHYSKPQSKSQQLNVKWINDVNFAEEQSNEFYPREYVRILPKLD